MFGINAKQTWFFCLACILAAHADDSARADEFRGMWITRFEWPNTNAFTAKANIDNMMTKLRDNRFNAVLFQVRGQADTLYPSPYEPWSTLISPSGADPGWDPLAYAVNAAHSRGLEFHAYINTHVGWQSAAHSPPASPSHLYYAHLDASAGPSRRDWLIHDASGNPVQYASDNYTWIAPGVPAAQAYLRHQILHVVRNYDVDGVHFDRIRGPGNTVSHDPASEARRGGPGNPDNLGFEDWTRDQTTRLLRDVYAEIQEVKPQVLVSSAPLGLYRSDRYPPDYPQTPCGYQYAYSCVLQDAQAWMAAGAMDFICPQIYWNDGGSNPDFGEVLPDWLANAAGRHIYAGQSRSVGLAELIHQIQATRTMGGPGNVVFSFSSFDVNNYWPGYAGPGGPYEQPAALPAMPWKDSPTTGVIIGVVTGPDQTTPVVDVWVRRSGSAYTALSSSDGLYSFLLVPPGTYTLTFDSPPFDQTRIDNVQVVAGGVTRVDVSLGIAESPSIVEQPINAAVCDGSTASFHVNADGATPLAYQWRRDGAPLVDDGRINGATSDRLMIADATFSDQAGYDCTVSNPTGSATSETASLKVWPVGTADLNEDGVANGADIPLFIFVMYDLDTPIQLDCAADVNGDGQADLADMEAFIAAMVGE